MRLFLVPSLIALVAFLSIDWFITRRLWKGNMRHGRMLAKGNIALTVILVMMMAVVFLWHPGEKAAAVNAMSWRAFMIAIGLIIAVPKYLWCCFYSLSCIKRLRDDVKTLLRWTGAGLAAASVVALLMGKFVTPFRHEVKTVDIDFESLPTAFDGYRIVHFSDAHLGSFLGDTTFVSQAVDAINALNPDAVCFTGDLVSLSAEEAKPFESVLKRIHARDGVYTILGNHDYAMYLPELSPAEKKADLDELCRIQQDAGWKILDNSSATITRGDQHIAIVGTSNYATRPPYPNYCNYTKSINGLGNEFKIYLQHNPQEWRREIVGKDIPLMLAGHTHAMQCVFHLFGTAWSPASFIYDEWGGLYSEGDNVLYVNTGQVGS